MAGLLIFVVIVALAIWFLRGFDKVAGRGPKQVSDGINQSSAALPQNVQRIPCPYCAEMIMPAAKLCPFCKSQLPNAQAPL